MHELAQQRVYTLHCYSPPARRPAPLPTNCVLAGASRGASPSLIAACFTRLIIPFERLSNLHTLSSLSIDANNNQIKSNQIKHADRAQRSTNMLHTKFSTFRFTYLDEQ